MIKKFLQIMVSAVLFLVAPQSFASSKLEIINATNYSARVWVDLYCSLDLLRTYRHEVELDENPIAAHSHIMPTWTVLGCGPWDKGYIKVKIGYDEHTSVALEIPITAPNQPVPTETTYKVPGLDDVTIHLIAVGSLDLEDQRPLLLFSQH